MSSDSTDTNPYLQARAEKIARNEERLRQLGLLTKPVFSDKPRKQAHQRKRATPTGVQSQSPQSAPEDRRSARLQNKNVAYKELGDNISERRKHPRLTSDAAQSPLSLIKSDAPHPFDEEDGLSPLQLTRKSDVQSPPNSARSIELNVNWLLYGTTNNSDVGLLGRQMSQTGKAFVMQESARLGAISGYENAIISFNKYSGVQEWKNDVLFLWVNLNPPQCQVVNEFLQEGRQVTWFGGSRMHQHTPSIQRLIKVGEKHSESATGSSGDCESGIVLWCRCYIPSQKTFTPYTCLGRLSYSSRVSNSSPISFVWNLMDYDKILYHPNKDVQEMFHSIVTPSG